MSPRRALTTLSCLASLLLAACGSPSSHPRAPETAAAASPAPAAAAAEARGPRAVVEDVAIKNYGKVIHRGRVDLSGTIERIREGRPHPHRNDGGVFGNRERLLPSKPRGYYREYVHPTPGLNGPGPQRIVVGSGDEWYYTPDHYATFVRIDGGSS